MHSINLLQNDCECEKRLKKCAKIQTGHCLRQLFVLILLFCKPTDVASLLLKFKDDLSEYILYFIKNHHCNDNSKIFNISIGQTLCEIQKLLQYHGKLLEDFSGLLIPKNYFATNM